MQIVPRTLPAPVIAGYVLQQLLYKLMGGKMHLFRSSEGLALKV